MHELYFPMKKLHATAKNIQFPFPTNLALWKWSKVKYYRFGSYSRKHWKLWNTHSWYFHSQRKAIKQFYNDKEHLWVQDNLYIVIWPHFRCGQSSLNRFFKHFFKKTSKKPTCTFFDSLSRAMCKMKLRHSVERVEDCWNSICSKSSFFQYKRTSILFFNILSFFIVIG